MMINLNTDWDKAVASMGTPELWEYYKSKDGLNKSAEGHWRFNLVTMELVDRGEFD